MQKNKTKSEEIGCGFCSKKRRVLNVSEFKIGQHIYHPGRYSLNYKKNHVLNYFHHAIIEKIKDRKENEATLVLIHYTSIKGKRKGTIQKKEEKKNLKHDEIYIVEYNYPKYTPLEIVRRANSQVKKEDGGGSKNTIGKGEDKDENESGNIKSRFGNYNLFQSNCEHFATWCVLDKQICFQLDRKRRILLFPFRVRLGTSGVFVNILGLFASILPLGQTHTPGLALLALGYLYLICLSFKLYRSGNNKSICPYCYEEELYILSTEFIGLLISSSILYMIISAHIPQFQTWPVIILTNVIFLIINACMQWFYKHQKSPFPSKCNKVKQSSHVKAGDVIIFRHYGFKHFAIATKVTKSGIISLVHYRFSLFRRILEEEEIKWPSKTVWRLDLRKISTFPPIERISRVRSRIGERKWHWLYNRSDHVCYWAVKKQSHWQYHTTGVNDETQNQTRSEQEISGINDEIQNQTKSEQKIHDINDETQKQLKHEQKIPGKNDEAQKQTESEQKIPGKNDETQKQTKSEQKIPSKNDETQKQTKSEQKKTGKNDEAQKQTKSEQKKNSKNDETQKKLSSLIVETAFVHLRNEIEIGDLVKFSVKYGNMKNGVGIVIEKVESEKTTERIFQLSIVIQTSKLIKQPETVNIDLNTDTLTVRKFHPVHCRPLEERKNRALTASKRNQKLNLIDFCILKESG